MTLDLDPAEFVTVQVLPICRLDPEILSGAARTVLWFDVVTRGDTTNEPFPTHVARCHRGDHLGLGPHGQPVLNHRGLYFATRLLDYPAEQHRHKDPEHHDLGEAVSSIVSRPNRMPSS